MLLLSRVLIGVAVFDLRVWVGFFEVFLEVRLVERLVPGGLRLGQKQRDGDVPVAAGSAVGLVVSLALLIAAAAERKSADRDGGTEERQLFVGLKVVPHCEPFNLSDNVVRLLNMIR